MAPARQNAGAEALTTRPRGARGQRHHPHTHLGPLPEPPPWNLSPSDSGGETHLGACGGSSGREAAPLVALNSCASHSSSFSSVSEPTESLRAPSLPRHPGQRPPAGTSQNGCVAGVLAWALCVRAHMCVVCVCVCGAVVCL